MPSSRNNNNKIVAAPLINIQRCGSLVYEQYKLWSYSQHTIATLQPHNEFIDIVHDSHIEFPLADLLNVLPKWVVCLYKYSSSQ